VVRFNARGYGKSSDVRRAREARWENRASDMIEITLRVRAGDGGDVVFAGASLGAATSIWATVLSYENGLKLPKAVVIVTPPTFYEERESRKKKLRDKVAKGVATENSLAPRRIFQAARDQPVHPSPPPLANPNDSCAVEVLIGSAQSNLPERERVRSAFADVPVLCLAWDCGDGTHPVSSAMLLKDLIPHAELVVASSYEDYDIVKHVRTRWSECIGEFIRRSVFRADV
jgi:pimeloyl-ACP methyl ester carboxylesterase